MPRVTTNEGIRSPTVSSPLAAPHSVPTASEAAVAGQTEPVRTNTSPKTTEHSARIDPTDRSISPTSSTKVIATASTTRSARELTMSPITDSLPKTGCCTQKNSEATAITAPSASRSA